MSRTVIIGKYDFKDATAECDLWAELLESLDLPEDTDYVELQIAE